MKLKTDSYTKIILTVIAIALIGNLIKDVDFVTKAHATPLELNLPTLKAEDASNDEGMTLYIYENDEVLGGFGKEKYTDYDFYTSSPTLKSKGYNDNKYKKAFINTYYDTPKYIITNKKGLFWLER